MKYVIYGGTFNPPHLAHIAIARHALLSGYDRGGFLPSGIPPHKSCNVSAPTRPGMPRLAAGGLDKVLNDGSEL